MFARSQNRLRCSSCFQLRTVLMLRSRKPSKSSAGGSSSSSSSPSTGVGPLPPPACTRWNKYACNGASSVKSGESSRTRVPAEIDRVANAPRKPAG